MLGAFFGEDGIMAERGEGAGGPSDPSPQAEPRSEMATETEVQYVSDANGNPVSVIVPIELWREIESERETAYLLKSETMKRRLLDAKERQQGLSLEETREELGI